MHIMTLIKHLLLASILIPSLGCSQTVPDKNTDKMSDSKIKNPYYSRTDTAKLKISNAEWKKVLPEDVYYIAREKVTERAFTGK